MLIDELRGPGSGRTCIVALSLRRGAPQSSNFVVALPTASPADLAEEFADRRGAGQAFGMGHEGVQRGWTPRGPINTKIAP
jgi:hypothetical protein